MPKQTKKFIARIMDSTTDQLKGQEISCNIINKNMSNSTPPEWFRIWNETVYQKQPPQWFREWNDNVYQKQPPQWFNEWNETEFKPLKSLVYTIIKLNNLKTE